MQLKSLFECFFEYAVQMMCFFEYAVQKSVAFSWGGGGVEVSPRTACCRQKHALCLIVSIVYASIPRPPLPTQIGLK